MVGAMLCMASVAQEYLTSAGFGRLSSVLTGGEALQANPAGVASLGRVAVHAGIERRQVWAGVHLLGVAVGVPTASGNFAVAVQSFGVQDFKKQEINLLYARKTGEKMHLGGSLDYHRLSISEYGSTGVFSFQIGLQAWLSPHLLIGTSIANPYPVKLGENEKLPTVFRTGLLYKVSEKVQAGMELEKDIDFSMRLRAGIEYLLVHKLKLKTGYSSNPSNFHFGLAFEANGNLWLHIGNIYDPVLGLTAGISGLYRLPK